RRGGQRTGAAENKGRPPAPRRNTAARPGRKRSPRRTSAAHSGASNSSRKRGSKTDTRPGSARLPDFVPPSLATLRTEAPTGPGWIHEIKFDGYRIQARLDQGKVRLLTRKGLDWTDKFPNIAAAVGKLPGQTALIDGEVVVEDERGVSNFSKLQEALKAKDREHFVYYVFDLLHLDGHDLTKLALVERKAALKRLLGAARTRTAPIRYSEHFDQEGS